MILSNKNLDKVLKEIKDNAARLNSNFNLFKAFQNDLNPLFQQKLRQISDEKLKTYYECNKEFVPYFSKSVKKLAQIYTFENKREFIGTKEKKKINDLITLLNVNAHLLTADEISTALQSCLIEVFFNTDTGMPELRVIPNSNFWVYSIDNKNNTINCIVKIIEEKTETRQEWRAKGFSTLSTYEIYTDEEILEVENNGTIISRNPNLFKALPFVYVNNDQFNIIPTEDKANESLAINPSWAITHANVVSWFQGHSKTVISNVDKKNSNIYMGPDGFWILNSEEGSDKTPSITQLPPTANLAEIQNFIKFKVEEYFWAKGCPIKNNGSTDKSGVSLLLESVDTLEYRKSKAIQFSKVDSELIKLVVKFHNFCVREYTADLNEDYSKQTISEKFTSVITYELPSTEKQQQEDSDVSNKQKDNKVKKDEVQTTEDSN